MLGRPDNMMDLLCVLVQKDPGVESKIRIPRVSLGIFTSGLGTKPWSRQCPRERRSLGNKTKVGLPWEVGTERKQSENQSGNLGNMFRRESIISHSTEASMNYEAVQG